MRLLRRGLSLLNQRPAPTHRARRVAGDVAAFGLAGIGALHAVWGAGITTWPGTDLRSLAEKVVGGSVFPSSGACYVVAALLGTASGLNGAAKSGNRSENLFARASWYEVGRSSDGSPRSSWAVGFVIWHLQRNRALSPGKPVALLATLSCSRRCDTMVLAQASDWVIGLVEPTQGPPVFQMSLHQRCLSVNSALACAWPPRRGRRVQRGRPLTHGW